MAQKDDWEYKLVVVVRSDVKMTKGKTAAQVAHAAVNCALQCKKKDPKRFDAWYNDSAQRKVVLKVDSQESLFQVKSVADAKGLVNSVIIDAGRTEIPSGTITCLGVGPATDAELEKVTGELKML